MKSGTLSISKNSVDNIIGDAPMPSKKSRARPNYRHNINIKFRYPKHLKMKPEQPLTDQQPLSTHRSVENISPYRSEFSPNVTSMRQKKPKN